MQLGFINGGEPFQAIEPPRKRAERDRFTQNLLVCAEKETGESSILWVLPTA
jgi:hypothetical protein